MLKRRAGRAKSTAKPALPQAGKPVTQSGQVHEPQHGHDSIQRDSAGRQRRYETAIGLAMDVQRHLNDEPVTAGPPTGAYLLRKLVRKYRAEISIATSLLVLLSLGVGWTFYVVFTTNYAIKIMLESQQAEIMNLERIYFRRWIEQNTLESLQQAIHIWPTNGLVFARLAKRTLAQTDIENPRRVDEADAYSRRAIQLSPNDPEVQRVRAEIADRIKNVPKP